MIRFPHLAFELTRLARAPRPYAVRFLFVAILLGFAALIWPWDAHLASDLLRGSSDIFTLFVQAEMVLAIIVVPALVAPAIPAEREAHTLELLVGCPEPEGRLVVGKLASHAVLVVAVLAAGFPVAFASTLLGGVPLERAATACVNIAMTAAFGTCIAIRCSLAWPGSVSATVAAVMLHAGTILSCALAAAITAAIMESGGEKVAGVFLLFCAAIIGLRWRHTGQFPTGCAGILLAFVVILGLLTIGSYHPRHAPHRIPTELVVYAICPWWAYAQDSLSGMRLPWSYLGFAWTIHGAACILILRRAFRFADSELLLLGSRAARLDRKHHPEAFRSEWRERERRAIEAQRAAGNLSVPEPPPYARLHLHPRADIASPSRVNPFLPVGRDPVYWKETSWARFPALDRLRIAAAALAWAGAVLAGIGIWLKSGAYSLYGLHLDIVLVALLVAAAGSTTLAPERENGTMAVLVSTGYPATRIVLGKTLAALRWCRSLFIPVSIHLFLAIGLLGGWGTAMACILVGTAFSVLGISVGVSGATRQPRLAFALTALAVLALWTIPGIAADQWLDAASLRVVNPFVALDDTLVRARHFTPFPDPRQLASFAAASLATALLPPALAAFFLERQVRA